MHDYDKKVIIKKAEEILQECNSKYEEKLNKKAKLEQRKFRQIQKLIKQNNRLKKINKTIIIANICMYAILIIILI